MAFRSEVHSSLADDVATQIVDAQAGDVDVWLFPLGAASVYVGGSDVDQSTGLPLVANSVFHVRVRPGDELWAISLTSDVHPQVRVLTRSA